MKVRFRVRREQARFDGGSFGVPDERQPLSTEILESSFGLYQPVNRRSRIVARRSEAVIVS